MTDSLYKVLQSSKEDTNKIKTLNLLCRALSFKSQFSESDSVAKAALHLSQVLGYKKGICIAYLSLADNCRNRGNYAESRQDNLEALKIAQEVNDIELTAHAYRNLGHGYYEEGNFGNALECYHHARKLFEESGIKNYQGAIYNDIGNIYSGQGNNPEALKYFLQALKIWQETGNKLALGATYNNIGQVYSSQGNYSEALKTQLLALKIKQETGNKLGISNAFTSIGEIYNEQHKYKEAIESQLQALKIAQDIGYKNGAANAYGNLGLVYENLGEHAEAQKNALLALDIFRQTGSRQSMAEAYASLGSICTRLKKYKEARKYLDSALELSRGLGAKAKTSEIYENYAILDSAEGDYIGALADYKSYIIYRDSIKNSETEKKILSQQMAFDFSHKQDSIKSDQERKDANADQARKKQVIIRNSLLAGFAVTLLLVFLIFRGYRQKHKANLELESKNRVIEEQKKEVDAAYTQLNEKHKEITDSINYAKRIQVALLKEEGHVSATLPEHFVLFRPRDVVSGDFYWSLESENTWYIAAVDCTGHGVPGAFLTMLGTAFLNEICSAKEIPAPAEILDRLTEKVIKELRGDGNVRDGMDISFAAISKNNDEGKTKVSWAGANNPLWYTPQPPKGGHVEMKEIVADKQPVGFQENQKPFTNHELYLDKGDILYLFTDGYADQFGGDKGKKYKYNHLKEQLLSINGEKMADQKIILERQFEQWKGAMEQTDDVCLIGIRI